MSSVQLSVKAKRKVIKRLGQDFARNKYVYLMVIPVLVFYILFKYGPMTKMIIAFQDYNLYKGIAGSKWVGLENFIDFFQMKDCWRLLRNTLLLSLYSIVFQDVTLFDNTILENIRLGRKGATDEEVLAAAKLANCEEFAEKLPDKWNTNIGENGCALSGGERQRISIARAFLKDAPIILLDEATASLDVENETAIQEALSRLIKHKTVLIIAHRMRTVAGADKIVVLSDGVVAEQGAPDALYARNGQYTHMVDLQTESQSWTI